MLKNMATPENISTSKNYIVSKINKNLLTPCRRVGLSRSKKTPKNNVLQTAIPVADITITPDTINECSTQCLSTKKLDVLDTNNLKQEISNILHTGIKTQLETTRNTITDVTMPQEATTSTPVNIKKGSSVRGQNLFLDNKPQQPLSPKLNKNNVKTGKNSKIPKRKAQTVVKGDADIDFFTTPKNDEQHIILEVPPSPCHLELEKESQLAEKFSRRYSEPGSPKTSPLATPTTSPLTTVVTVQVHQPAAKRNIDFNEVDQIEGTGSSKNLIAATEKAVFPIGSDPLDDIEENLSLRKSKKRKLRLSSDDFDSIEDEKPSDPCYRKDVQPNVDTPTNSKALARFKTEDYLAEYSKNPNTFHKYLEMENLSSTMSEHDYDDLDDFMPITKVFKTKKTKADTLKETKRDKNYVAICCTSILSKSDKVNELKQSCKTTKQLPSKKNLTISLERMSNGSTNKHEQSDTKNRNIIIKKERPLNSRSTFENDDDDMFTSSPESDKKQRENLLRLITEAENEVIQKKEMLERLKRAQVYKKMHSPAKLNQTSDQWLEACRTALQDLLVNMQEHGPMEMDSLIKNLKIPVHVVEKLKF